MSIRKPHGPATERRAKILALLRVEMANLHPARRDAADVVAKAVKVSRRTVLAVARAYDIPVARKPSKVHKLARVQISTFVADVAQHGAQAVARRLRVTASAVYDKLRRIRLADAAENGGGKTT